MPGKPHQSILIPHEQETAALRRRSPPVPYAQIAEILRQKHGLIILSPVIFVADQRRGLKSL